MIPHESFTYGLNGGSIKYQPSSDKVKELLGDKNLEYLIKQTIPANLESVIVEHHFKKENLVTVTKLDRTVDSFERSVVNNKTVIIRMEDYLKMFPPRNAVSSLLM